MINDVALNFGGRHFWAPLFTLILRLMDAFEEESSGGGGGDTVCPGSQVVEAGPTPGPQNHSLLPFAVIGRSSSSDIQTNVQHRLQVFSQFSLSQIISQGFLLLLLLRSHGPQEPTTVQTGIDQSFGPIVLERT